MIWLQVAFMIVHMHQKGFLYRDLKAENVLIDERGFVKLCDFGYSTKY
jgi:serine/threonine protein kinase